jgi:hypothetical protein
MFVNHCANGNEGAKMAGGQNLPYWRTLTSFKKIELSLK